jgi:DNA-binding transcriptional LysR family regulator
MTLKQLEAFYWAATLGTFAIAAERLFVTQSSLSKRIAELESDVGQALFDRSRQRAVLTAAGQAMLPQAQRMLDLEQAIRQGLEVEQAIGGPCRLGISELSATTWFPAFVQRVREDHPQLELKPQVGLGKSLERLVERGELDFAVVTGSIESAVVDFQTVAQVDFAWMANPARLRKGTLLDASLFQSHPVISSAADSGLNGALQAWTAASGIRVGEVVSCNSLNAILGMTVAGVGISFLPVRYVAPLVKRKLLVELRSDPPLPLLGYHFIWRRDDSRRLVASMRQLVVDEADFTISNPLWTF